MDNKSTQFADIMKLEQHGPDTFVGVGPRYPWGSLYGGQIVAQGLKAAAQSVTSEHKVHSLHAYFIRRGQHDAPVRFEVDRIRDGRSFTTRRVVARQSEGAILNMSCSFQLPEGELAVQTRPMPEVARPDDEKPSGWIPLLERRNAASEAGHQAAWFRTEVPGDHEIDHACALAYFSDNLPCEAIMTRHPEPGNNAFWMASLDHAIWFHHAPRADDWQLHDVRCQSLVGSRGLAIGHVFASNGIHLATVSQEALLRRGR